MTYVPVSRVSHGRRHRGVLLAGESLHVLTTPRFGPVWLHHLNQLTGGQQVKFYSFFYKIPKPQIFCHKRKFLVLK